MASQLPRPALLLGLLSSFLAISRDFPSAVLATLSSAEPFEVVFEVERLQAKLAGDPSSGSFTVKVYPDWAPIGAQRFRELVEANFYDECRFFRVIDGFMAQFGISGNPEVAAEWKEKRIKDDRRNVRVGNRRGRISFAMAGPDSRTTQVFINFKGNDNLDSMGFRPFAEVSSGMHVVDCIFKVGEGAPNGPGPMQRLVQQSGNEYLEAEFPKLTYIKRARIKVPSAASEVPSTPLPSAAPAATRTGTPVPRKPAAPPQVPGSLRKPAAMPQLPTGDLRTGVDVRKPAALPQLPTGSLREGEMPAGAMAAAEITRVECVLTTGSITIDVHPDWAPLGSKRFLELVEARYFDDSALFRAIKSFLVQFGISGNEKLRTEWGKKEKLLDDPLRPDVPVRLGTMAFAGSGENSRTTQVWIALTGHDKWLGKRAWETPFAQVVGMQSIEALQRITTQYGDTVDQAQIWTKGNSYLKSNFPNMDYIKTCRVVEHHSEDPYSNGVANGFIAAVWQKVDVDAGSRVDDKFSYSQMRDLGLALLGVSSLAWVCNALAWRVFAGRPWIDTSGKDSD